MGPEFIDLVDQVSFPFKGREGRDAIWGCQPGIGLGDQRSRPKPSSHSPCFDEMDETSGKGWAALAQGRLVGPLQIPPGRQIRIYRGTVEGGDWPDNDFLCICNRPVDVH